MTTFTVILATRNRPALFAAALESVVMQQDAAFDIVVVMDGSGAEYERDYATAFARLPAQTPIIRLPRTARGHGQSYAINTGAQHGAGAYLCFLDDDDVWTDRGHLSRAAASLAAGTADLYLADQDAYRGETPFTTRDGVWLEALRRRPERLGPADALGARPVSAEVLMRLFKHCHLNTMILRRTLFQAIGGMDEDIRYDCDRDLYLRAVDRAERILYAGCSVARHNVPDPAQGTAMSTSISVLQKQLYQLRVFEKSILFARQPCVAAHAAEAKSFVQRHLATTLAEQGRRALAARYAREALGGRFSLKWLGYSLWLSLRAGGKG